MVGICGKNGLPKEEPPPLRRSRNVAGKLKGEESPFLFHGIQREGEKEGLGFYFGGGVRAKVGEREMEMKFEEDED